jgi:hypothetical protein
VEPRVAYNEGENRYYAVVIGLDRAMTLFVSNTDASSWTQHALTDSAGTGIGLGRTFMPAGLVCDSHSNESSGAPSCRLYYAPYGQPGRYHLGQIRRCNIFNNALSSCADSSVSAIEPTDVADYGNGVPAGYYAGPAWILSVDDGVLNTDRVGARMVLDNDTQFLAPIVDEETLWNQRRGWSLDWCEYLDRVIAASEG